LSGPVENSEILQKSTKVHSLILHMSTMSVQFVQLV